MSPRLLKFVGVSFLVATLAGLAQETPSLPATSRSDADCTGFIVQTPVAAGVSVFGGADDHLRAHLRQYSTGDLVYLRGTAGSAVAPNAEFAIIRPGKYLFQESRYPGEFWAIRSLGTPYEDVGRLKVTHVTSEGAVAQVSFACGPVYNGDLAVPYQPRTIPEYTPSTQLDRFAPPNGKLVGGIFALKNNAAATGQGGIVYLNMGQNWGVKPGQRFRIFAYTPRPILDLNPSPNTPRESKGELVILSTQERSAVGVIVNCLREVFVRDGVELE